MSIDPVKVPADVQVEEKIFGPVGLRQIMIMMITGGISYVIWTAAQRAGYVHPLAQGLCWLPLVIGSAFAFIKIHDVTLLRLLLLNVEKTKKPAVRTFGPRAGLTINIHVKPADLNKKEYEAEAEPEANLDELTSILDTGVSKLASKPNRKFPKAESRETEKVEIDIDQNLPKSAEPVDPKKISADPLEDNFGIDGFSDFDEDTNISPGGIFGDMRPSPPTT